MNALATSLLDKLGTASIWRTAKTLAKVVAVYPHSDRLRLVVMATETVPGLSTKGGLYDIEATSFTVGDERGQI